ncbi:MAG: D-threitol dehydrogenase [Treponema sp.]|jgi:NAD(P)-dependent dehydrogenase (short-subunit alcohol dehydrogenase family)|nr:D-threitol dehydrogenase [Treponema sp.]
MIAYKPFDLEFNLTGKVCLITGGASGIGKSIVKTFAKKRAIVIALDVNEEIEKLAKELDPQARGVRCDLSRVSEIKNTVAQLMKEYKTIDVLCNVAGLPSGAPAAKVTEDDWDRTFAVNLKGLFFMSQAIGNNMIKSGTGGKIINISSQAALVGLENHTVYGATKAAVLNITKTMALEWGQYGINVNAIAPVVTMTPMGKAYWVGERAEKFLKELPVGRFAEPEETAAVALFLASDASNMITGETIVIDGGYTIH